MNRVVSVLLLVGLMGTPLRIAVAAATPTSATPAAGSFKGKEADEFTGFGKVRFGASYFEVKKLYPAAEDLAEGKDLGSPAVGGPYIRRLVLNDQKFDGLPKPVVIELRFWKNKLWNVIIYLGDNDDHQVFDMLNKRLGPSDSAAQDYPQWERSTTQTTMDRKQRWFAVSDLAPSREAQAWFAQLMRGEWKGATQEELVELGWITPQPTVKGDAAAAPGTPAPTAAK